MPVKEKPRFFYGYVVASAVFLIMMLSWGTLYSFGIFFKPLLNEFGWTRSTISTAFSLSILLYGALTIVAGRLNDKYGPRVVITICGLLFSFGYLVMSQTTTIWQLYLCYCLIGIGMSGFFVPLVSTIARWFNRKRGMMTGIGMSGVGIGTIIIPLIMASFINSYGWRTSYVIVGFITLLSIAGIAQFLRREPSITKSIPQDGELIGTDDLPPENWSSYNVSLRPIERGSKWSKGVTHRSKSLAS